MRTTLLFLFLGLCFSFNALASIDDPNDGKIDVVYSAEKLAPYKERRGTWGFVFGISSEQILPTKFRSKIDNKDYTALFGSAPLQYGQLELGTKLNFMLGSLGVSALIGNGGAHDGRSGQGRTFNATKKGVQAVFALDNLFSEPYVVPYGGTQFVSWDWTEFADTTLVKETGSTSMTGGITFGALFQLDWLLPFEALNARNAGVENTFLDIYVTQYNASTTATEQNLQTDMNYGVGLKVEY